MRVDDRFRETTRVALFTDETVGALYAHLVLTSLRSSGFDVEEFRFAAGEASKGLATVERAIDFLSRMHLGRDGLVVALGGGVVSDLAGFVASVWMRGVPLVICPTTLESAIDASIGGKTGINIPGGKNLVGVFHPALVVATDPTCLATLEARDVAAGMAESIKHGLITGEAFTAWQETHVEAIRALDETVLTELIERNARIKCDIVQRDPYEQRTERMFLNFGHTIGHAIESCGDYRLRHGECVALGMVSACRISRELGLCDQALVARAERLLQRFNLPTRLEVPTETDRLMACIRNDKKAKGNVPRFVLLEGVGRPVIHSDVSEDLLRGAIESLLR